VKQKGFSVGQTAAVSKTEEAGVVEREQLRGMRVCEHHGLAGAVIFTLPQFSLSLAYLLVSASTPDGLASVSRYSRASEGMHKVSANSWFFIQ